MIKIDFEKISEDEMMIYRDALYLPDDHTYTNEEIEAMKQDRFDRWYLAVTTPPTEITTEEMLVDVLPIEDVIVNNTQV